MGRQFALGGRKEQHLKETSTVSLPWATHKAAEEESRKALLALERGGRRQKGGVKMGEKPWTAVQGLSLAAPRDVLSVGSGNALCASAQSSWSLSYHCLLVP